MLEKITTRMRSYKKSESLFSAIYIGSIFIILGLIYLSSLPESLWLDLINFFSSLTLAQVPPATGIYLPAPLTPALYANLYMAAFEFCIGIGIVEAAILVLRFLFQSPISRKAETISNVVFWFGSSYLIITYLNNNATINTWFVFWTGIILIFGLSLIARAFVLLAWRQTTERQPTESPQAK